MTNFVDFVDQKKREYENLKSDRAKLYKRYARGHGASGLKRLFFFDFSHPYNKIDFEEVARRLDGWPIREEEPTEASADYIGRSAHSLDKMPASTCAHLFPQEILRDRLVLVDKGTDSILLHRVGKDTYQVYVPAYFPDGF